MLLINIQMFSYTHNFLILFMNNINVFSIGFACKCVGISELLRVKYMVGKFYRKVRLIFV